MTTTRGEVYKCEVCGIVATVLDGGAGEPICCGQRMKKLDEKTADEGKEKHVPVVEESDDGLRVKVGSVEHPMEEKHYIQWIELIAFGKSIRKFLEPGQKPEAFFAVQPKEYTVREYCTLHGLWNA